MRVIHGRGVQSALHWLHNLISHHVPLYYQENPRPFFPDWEGRQWWHVSTLLPVSCPRCPQGWNHRWEPLDYFSLWRPQYRPTLGPNAAWLPKATKMGLWAEAAATQEVSGGQNDTPGPGGHRAQRSSNHQGNLPAGPLRGWASSMHLKRLLLHLFYIWTV